MSAAARGHSGASDFNPLSPDGTYTLNLALPPDRSVALRLCELDAASTAGGAGVGGRGTRNNEKFVLSCVLSG